MPSPASQAPALTTDSTAQTSPTTPATTQPKSAPSTAGRPSLLLPPGGPPATIVSPPTPVTPVDNPLQLGGSAVPSEVLILEEPEEYESPGEDVETASTASSSFVHTPAQQSMNVPPQFSVSRGNSSSSSAPAPFSTPYDSMSPGVTGKNLSSLVANPAPTPSSPRVYMPRIPSPSAGTQDSRPQVTGKERRHRRESSTHRVRETIYGETRSTVDGQRMVNQYRLGKTLGKGSYASVEHAIDVGTGIEYVSVHPHPLSSERM